MGMSPEILCYDDGSEGLSDETHLFQPEVLPHGLQITDIVSGTQEHRVRELGAPAASLIVENDHAVPGERFEIRPAVIYACAGPAVNHDDRIVARSGHLVKDFRPTRTGHIARCRHSGSCLVIATSRRDEHEQGGPEVTEDLGHCRDLAAPRLSE
jgi:hypothetical protein